MSYAVFANNRLIAMCSSYKKALDAIPRDKEIRIFDENGKIIYNQRCPENE